MLKDQSPIPTEAIQYMKDYRYPFIVIVLSSILIDSLSKKWFWNTRPDILTGNYFEFIYFQEYQNTGLMLGIGGDLDPSIRMIVGVVVVGLLLVSLFLWLIYKGFSSHMTAFSWGLMVGGGTSNWLERMRTGAVSDFVQIDFGFIQSGVFNMADFLNLSGLIVLIFAVLKYSKVR